MSKFYAKIGIQLERRDVLDNPQLLWIRFGLGETDFRFHVMGIIQVSIAILYLSKFCPFRISLPNGWKP